MKDGTPLVTRSIERVRSYILTSGVRKAEFARSAGVPKSSLTGAETEDWNPTSDTLRRLEGAIPEGWQPGAPLSDADAEAA